MENCKASATQALAYLTIGETLSVDDLGGSYLAPGTYNAAGAVDLTGTLSLVVPDGVTNPLWSFDVGGALTTAAFYKLVFVDGDSGSEVIDGAAAVALFANVHFKVAGSL